MLSFCLNDKARPPFLSWCGSLVCAPKPLCGPHGPLCPELHSFLFRAMLSWQGSCRCPSLGRSKRWRPSGCSAPCSTQHSTLAPKARWGKGLILGQVHQARCPQCLQHLLAVPCGLASSEGPLWGVADGPGNRGSPLKPVAAKLGSLALELRQLFQSAL